MKSVLKFTITFGTGLMLLGGCSLHTNDTAKKSISQQQINKTKTYFGIVPCASCSGIKTWIRMDDNKRFSTIEEYMDEDDGVFVESGKVLNKGNSIYALKSERNEGMVTFKDNSLYLLGQDKKLNSLYALERLDEFSTKNQNLFVHPKSVKKSNDSIKFYGVLNLSKKRNSISANFEIDKNYNVKISDAKYYKNSYALGDEIDKEEFLKNQNKPLLKDDLIKNIFQYYDK